MAVVAISVIINGNKKLGDVLANWDVQHFLAIAEKGYVETNDVAFFPLWPLLLKLIPLSGMPVIATASLLAAGFSLLAVFALYRLGGRGAAIAWLLAPTAVFTVVPYTESLFCAAAFWAWERAGKQRWGQAAVLAAIASGVRISGLFLIGALAIYALTQQLQDPANPGQFEKLIARGKRLLWLLLPLAVLAGFAVYLFWLRGSWTSWYEAQAAGWNRGFTWPWETFQHTLAAASPDYAPGHPEWHWMFKTEIISWLVGLIVTGVCLFRRNWAEAGWVGVQVAAFSTSHWLISVSRATLLWFPLWTQLGKLGETRSASLRYALLGLAVVMLIVQQLWAWFFFTGAWAS